MIAVRKKAGFDISRLIWLRSIHLLCGPCDQNRDANSLVRLVFQGENGASPGMIWRTYNAIILQLLDECCRTIVPDFQATLQIGCRGTLVAQDNGEAFLIEILFLSLIHI